MFTTFVFFAIFTGILLTSAALWAFFLWLGLRWADVLNLTTRGIVVTAAIVMTLQLGLSFLMRFALPPELGQSSVGVLCEVLLTVALQLGVIGAIYKLPMQQVFQAWLLTLFASAATIVIAVLIVRPALYGTFVIPTNSMAPTLVGVHIEGICPECEGKSFGTPIESGIGSTEPPSMICDSFHVGPAALLEDRTFEGDRILVAKFLSPRRWDVIAFRLPAQPEILNVKRIVGLPGEEIQIRDGAVWVDGKKLTTPEQLTGLEYLNGIPELPQITFWGSPQRPAILGNDEYFVLGDFSAQSTDSRFWESGAFMHNAFAVPNSHTIGVVTHTYWPFGRIRIHR